MVVDAGGVSTPGSDAGSRSWRLLNDRSPAQHGSQRFDEGNQTTRRAWDRDRQNLSHRY
jgi:hypothetical protein